MKLVTLQIIVTVVILIFQNLLCAALRDPKTLLPTKWSEMCQQVNTGNTSYIAIFCNVTAVDSWDFNDFRKWSAILDNDTRISVTIVCDDGGKVCLPWPYRANNLDTLKVTKCINVCQIEDYTRPDVLETIPDSLRVFEGYDIIVQKTITELINIDFGSLSPALECGPLSVETYINQGARTRFVADNFLPNALEDNITNFLTSSVLRVNDLQHKCHYRNMRVYDVSRKVHASSTSLYNLVVNSFFPELQVLNLSSTELQSFPREFQVWRGRFPKLKTLDISHNNISRFDNAGDFTSTVWFLNMTYNDIETIGKNEIKSFTHGTGVIDVRENPLRCNCAMADFNDFLRINKSPEQIGMNSQYSYLWSLTCVAPQSLREMKIADLSRSTLCNSDVTSYKTAVGILSSVVVLLLFGIFLIAFTRRCKLRNYLDRERKDKITSKQVDVVENKGIEVTEYF